MPASTATRGQGDLVAYFVLAFAISWAIEVPIALSVHGAIAAPAPLALHYLASFGPLLAAAAVTLVRDGPPGLQRLFGGLARWRVGWSYVLFALAVPAVSLVVAVLISRLAGGAWPDLGLLGRADYLPYLGILPALALWLLTFGVGEEVGWRGFALPRLQARRTALSASLIIGALWALWHIPALFYRPSYTAMGLFVVPLLLLIAIVGGVVYTWLYNGTGGSLLWVALFHGLYDYLSVWPGAAIGPGVLMTIVMVFYAVRAYKVYGPENLAPLSKVTA